MSIIIRRVLDSDEFMLESLVECQTALAEPDGKTHLLSIMDRPGAKVLNYAIEWTWYKPNTLANNLFGMRIIEWEEMNFTMASFPTRKLSAVKHLANLLLLQIIDRIPMLVVDAKHPEARKLPDVDAYVAVFPLVYLPNTKTPNRNILFVENNKGSAIYQNTNDDIIARENIVIKALSVGLHLTPQQIVDFIYRGKKFDV